MQGSTTAAVFDANPPQDTASFALASPSGLISPTAAFPIINPHAVDSSSDSSNTGGVGSGSSSCKDATPPAAADANAAAAAAAPDSGRPRRRGPSAFASPHGGSFPTSQLAADWSGVCSDSGGGTYQDATPAAAAAAALASGTISGTPRRRGGGVHNSPRAADWSGSAWQLWYDADKEEEEDASVTQEERCFRMWINSLGQRTKVASLFGPEVRSGWLLLEVLEYLQVRGAQGFLGPGI